MPCSKEIIAANRSKPSKFFKSSSIPLVIPGDYQSFLIALCLFSNVR